MKYYKLKGTLLHFLSKLGPSSKLAAYICNFKSVRTALRHIDACNINSLGFASNLPPKCNFTVSFRENPAFEYCYEEPDVVGWNLFRYNFLPWEDGTGAIFSKLISKTSSFIDIGANTGLYTLVAGAINSKCNIISLEPNPLVFKKLAKNVHKNNLANVQLKELALSNFDGIGELHIPDEASMASLNKKGFRGLKGKIVTVKITQLQTLISSEQIELMKIDVEGFEPEVLLGGSKILGKLKPTIIVECNPDGPAQRLNNIINEINSDYKIFHIRDTHIKEVCTISPHKEQSRHNYLIIDKHNSKHLCEI
jgi:FkbM family methyltransferase